MSDMTRARNAVVARILEGDGRASHAQRRAAFDNAGLAAPLNTLIDKVAKRAYLVTEEDIAAVKASGLSEDQIFELVVCAAIGQATRQYDTAFAALDAATERNDYASRNPR
jgi:alkylhydroperoxidase family enzyme